MRGTLEGRSVIVAMCVGQLGSLLPHVVVPSILAAFLIPEWHLSGAQAGLLAGSGAAGYMLTVPVLATLTDRIDARKILIAGSALSALGTLLFGLFASGLWTGALFNAIAGVGFAGAYMPGLKALTDRLAPGDSSRAITLYTSSFSFGVGLSFLVSQLVAESFGWRTAFFVTAAGPLVMLLACSLLRPVQPKPAQGRLLDFAPVFRNTEGNGYWMFTDHAAILDGLQHPDLWSSSVIVPSDPDPPYKRIPVMIDPPDHAKWRHVLGEYFSPGLVKGLRDEQYQLAGELALQNDLSQVMRDASICGLGQTASSAMESALQRWNLFA